MIRSMKDQSLKAIPTTDNLIDMVIFEILNNLNFYGVFINAEEVDFIEELERYKSFLENKFARLIKLNLIFI